MCSGVVLMWLRTGKLPELSTKLMRPTYTHSPSRSPSESACKVTLIALPTYIVWPLGVTSELLGKISYQPWPTDANDVRNISVFPSFWYAQKIEKPKEEGVEQPGITLLTRCYYDPH